MPVKNSIKSFIENGYYHVYNRGVEKRRIFEEAEDYKKFLYYLKIYLAPLDKLRVEFPLLRAHVINGNLAEEIDLLAFCLMPNHFHLLLHQKSKDAMTKLMRQISTAYSMYFNQKYERSGRLFQGIYKACIVENEEYLLHLSRYIHQNPQERGANLSDFPWSSYSAYLGTTDYNWLKPQLITGYFNDSNPNLSYRNFVEVKDNIPPQTEIEHLTLD